MVDNRKNRKDDEDVEGLPFPQDPFHELSYDSYKSLLEERVILLNGTVKEDIVERVVVPLLRMGQTKNPIQIWINSYGGSMEDGQAVVDVIQALKNPVVTVAFGKAMSAAFDIFLAGDHRILYPNTILMCHSGSASLAHQTLPSISIEAQLHEAYFRRWAKFYAARTKIAEDEWFQVLKGGLNRYFFPEEALQKGLAHRVIVPQKKNLKSLGRLKW